MRRKFIIQLIQILVMIIFLSACSERSEEKQNVTIGSGEIMDLFNPAVNILTRSINIKHSIHDIHATPVTTSGSGENLKKLFDGALDLALVNDIPAILAYQGSPLYKKYSNHSDLRSVCSFFCDCLVFVANAKSNISNLHDIRGKKIAIASSESAAIGVTSKYLFKFLGISSDDFQRYNYGLEKSIIELDKGNIDGFLYMTAQPNPYLIGITNSQQIKCKFIPITEDQLEKLKLEYPSLIKVNIPKTMYPNSINKKDTATIGSRALLLTMSNMNNKIIYNITKEIVENFSAFYSVHPTFQEITPESMVKNLTLPVHPGALEYYREKGLAKYIPKALLPAIKE